MRAIKATFTRLIAIAASFVAEAALAQVPEVADPNLPDIAQVRMTPGGPIIVYNPYICAQMGPLACSFMRAHEYGHVVLGHALGMTFPPIAEMEADCWAARNATYAEVTAMIQAFQFQGMGGDAAHGTGFQRAQRVYDAFTNGFCHW